jgi:hypothetical protein
MAVQGGFGLPSSVSVPVDFFALARLAASRFSETAIDRCFDRQPGMVETNFPPT